MDQLKILNNSLKTILLEVTKQLEDTVSLLEHPKQKGIDKIHSRDDYIDNLKSNIEKKCFTTLIQNPNFNNHQINQVRAIQTIAINLEHIADSSVTIVRQLSYLNPTQTIRSYNYPLFFKEIFSAISIIEEALNTEDLELALKICHSEYRIDAEYKKVFDLILEGLSKREEAQNLVTVLFIFRNLEFIGDSLLNIGEAIISAVVGEKLKLRQYIALDESLHNNHRPANPSNFEFKSFSDTRSGCRVGKVIQMDEKDEYHEVVFKEGKKDKIIKEKENINFWNQLVPGLVPKVIQYHEHGMNASILVENLNGLPLQEIICNGTSAQINQVMTDLKQVLSTIWEQTLSPEVYSSNFMYQMQARMMDVYSTHPKFQRTPITIGSLKLSSLNELVEMGQEIENQLKAPFSVFIHGDFNNDNVIYDEANHHIYFVDLHRSAYQDFVQDISVFLVSNFRMPIFNNRIRHRLNWLSQAFFKFGKQFAKKHGDTTFEARLALGLIRSFFTSTRFEFRKSFARSMYLRSLYLFEKLIEHQPKPWGDFHFSKSILTY